VAWLAKSTAFFSMAEIEELAQRIRKQAFQRDSIHVEQADFTSALKSFKIDTESCGITI
jgi:hypothetical protein